MCGLGCLATHSLSQSHLFPPGLPLKGLGKQGADARVCWIAADLLKLGTRLPRAQLALITVVLHSGGFWTALHIYWYPHGLWEVVLLPCP